MITNFENITYELNKYETQTLLPLVLRGLRYKYGKKMAVTNKTAIEALKLRGCVISSPRFRKIVQYIRINNLINNLISTKKGYYIAITEEERIGIGRTKYNAQ